MKNLRKGFTLVEMLIVVVIIGILAAALIPRLMGAQSSARDVARIANVKDIVTAAAAYNNDTGDFPNDGVDVGPASNLYKKLSERKLITEVPTDPQKGTEVAGVEGFTASDAANKGQYPFILVNRNGSPKAAIVVVAKVENPGKANWIIKKGTTNEVNQGAITAALDVTTMKLCTKLETGTFALNDGTGKCVYEDDSELRYVQFY